ncbi:MAG: gliding motility lipoprotein GldH [Bacteroidales bacterium]
MNKKIVYSIVAALVMLAAACSENVIYEANVDIPKETWSADSTANFMVNIEDTSSVFNIHINLRNTTSYPNSNLYLFVQTISPSGAVLRDTVEYFLADSKGKWLGKGFGSIRDNRFLYKQYIRFPEDGTYTFGIQQGMRSDNLKGVSSIGMRVEKVK